MPNDPIRPADNTAANPTRRGVITSAAALAAAGAAGLAPTAGSTARADHHEGDGARAVTRGRIKQSVCKWCYGSTSLEDLAAAAAAMGLVSVELLGPEAFGTLKEHGLICAMVSSHPLDKGLADPQYWDNCIETLHQRIDQAADAGFPNVITFSGNRRGIDDRKGMSNCAEALAKVVPHAEERGVTLCMELLNSRVNHPDYMCDKSAWGVELCKRVGSDRFRLLYDIYHMQIMEGDLIRTIERDHEFFAHYHTAGNPGRHEMDETQEMYYPAIVRAIIDTGYTGYLGQEFIPVGEPIAALRAMAKLCDV